MRTAFGSLAERFSRLVVVINLWFLVFGIFIILVGVIAQETGTIIFGGVIAAVAFARMSIQRGFLRLRRQERSEDAEDDR